MSVEATVFDILESIMGYPGANLSQQQLPMVAAIAARRGAMLEALLERIRTVQRDIISRLLSLPGDGPLAADTVDQLVGVVSEIVDSGVDRFVRAYLTERELMITDAVTQRRAVIDALISGCPITEAQAQEDLQIDISRYHLGIVLTRPGNSVHDLERLAGRLRSALPGASRLSVLDTPGCIWVWLSTETAPTASDLARLTLPSDSREGTRCFIGEPASGAVGFRKTHLQSRMLAQHQQLRPVRPDVTTMWWADWALVAMLSADLEKAAWFVKTQLGPLADDSATAAEQRETLWAYLSTGCSLRRAAEMCHVHRNTIVYRISKIEAALGDRLYRRNVEVQCALQLVQDLGAGLLQQ